MFSVMKIQDNHMNMILMASGKTEEMWEIKTLDMTTQPIIMWDRAEKKAKCLKKMVENLAGEMCTESQVNLLMEQWMLSSGQTRTWL